jgi:hypothetical protein
MAGSTSNRPVLPSGLTAHNEAIRVMIGAMVDKLFDSVESSNADAEAVWIAALALGVAALRHTDELGRERLLRGVERELRHDLGEFDRLLEAKNDASS